MTSILVNPIFVGIMTLVVLSLCFSALGFFKLRTSMSGGSKYPENIFANFFNIGIIVFALAIMIIIMGLFNHL
jgi:uncharacterized membrane protein YidH (DUF202 family)